MYNPAQISLNPDCAGRLAKAGTLAGMFRIGSTGTLGLPPGRALNVALPDVAQAFQANGVAILLTALPFGQNSMAALSQFSLLAGLVACIQDHLKVNLLGHGGPIQVQNALLAKLKGRSFTLPTNAAYLQELLPIASCARLLKSNLNIDLLAPDGAAKIGAFLSGPGVQMASQTVVNRTLGLSILDRLSQLSLASAALGSFKALRMLGVGLAPGAASMSVPIGSLLSSSFQPLWASLSGGSIASVRLPNTSTISNWNAYRATLAEFERLLGLSATDPRFKIQLNQKLEAFRAHDICWILRNSPLAGPSSSGVLGLPVILQSLNNVRTATGVSLLEPGAGSKLVPKLDELVKLSSALNANTGQLASIVAPLKRLADLAVAVG
jgi:hypothetical protein